MMRSERFPHKLMASSSAQLSEAPNRQPGRHHPREGVFISSADGTSSPGRKVNAFAASHQTFHTRSAMKPPPAE
jgi:hypothetical protein